MTVPDLICVFVVLLFLGFCIWLESRAIARYRDKQAKEREAFLEAFWFISDTLVSVGLAIERTTQIDVPSDQGDAL